MGLETGGTRDSAENMGRVAVASKSFYLRMNIDIVYRCCGKEVYPDQRRSSRPSWFDKIKCYKSVWDMTQQDPSTFSMHVIYDGERSPLLDYIEGMRVSDS